jgi:Transcription factor S-II (TFIIS), central domain
MLSFNLSQPDRHHLRRSIGNHTLPALQLSQMSSVDLANEQTKQQIEAANRESLEHSILTQRPVAARAKITHKGEEIIEDLVGDDIGRRIRDEEQRDSEREREREKGARERTKMLPPQPPTPKEPSFQGPQDILARQHNAASQMAAQIQAQARRPPPLATSSSLMDAAAEPSFKLDDLIAIDLPDDSPPQESTSLDSDSKISTSTSPAMHMKPDGSAVPVADSSPSPASRSASFDLNHVWSGASSEHPAQGSSGSPILSARADDARDPPSIDIDLGAAADDEDFDMFLDQPDAIAAAPLQSVPEAERAVFEALPIVWSGTVSVFFDSAYIP